MSDSQHWLPTVNPPEIATALAWDHTSTLWAGGVGGVASYSGSTWSSHTSGLPLTAITALLPLDHGVLAGGLEGIALFDRDARTWQRASIDCEAHTITAFAASPTFAEDRTLLAASLTAGILKSTDGGISWTESSFGLQTVEMLALLWDHDALIAASDHGLYRSPNQGRAWKPIYDGEPVIALSRLADGTIAAALESGGLIFSVDHGSTWHGAASAIGEGRTILALAGSLIGTDDGLFERDATSGAWHRIRDGECFALAVDTRSGARTAAAIGNQIHLCWNVPDAPEPVWTLPPPPPIHDLRHVIAVGDAVLAAGRHSGVLRYDAGSWHTAAGTPLPLTLITRYRDRLYASGINGLFSSHDHGVSWQSLWDGLAGHLSHLAFLTDTLAFGSRADGSHLVRSSDGGRTWQTTPSPFGALPVVALEVTPQMILIAVFDPRRSRIVLWRSMDGGMRWFPGIEVASEWGIAASFAQPLLIALPDALLVCPLNPADPWIRAVFDVPGVRVRKLTGTEHIQYALSHLHGVFQSTDGGRHWSSLALDLDPAEIADVDFYAGKLAVLMTGGRILIVA